MRVKDPEGMTWRVGRRWLPWRRRFRGPLDVSGIDVDLPSGDDPVTAAIGLILFVVGLVIALPALLLLLGAILELAALAALVPLLVGVRIALGRSWTVQVVDDAGVVRHTEQVAGWRASGERVAELAGRLRSGNAELR